MSSDCRPAPLPDAERVRDLLQRARGTAVSPDQTVSVTVVPGNAVTELVLTDEALLHHDGVALGRLIVRTIAAAGDSLDQILVTATAEIAPLDIDIAGNLAGELPAPVPAERLGALPGTEFLAEIRLEEPTQPTGHRIDSGSVTTRAAGTAPVTQDLDRLARAAQRRAARYADVYGTLTQFATTATSADERVAVTVSTGGFVEEITIDEVAYERGPEHVADLVLSTVRLAAGRTADRSAEHMRKVMGATLDVGSLVEDYLPPEVRRGR